LAVLPGTVDRGPGSTVRNGRAKRAGKGDEVAGYWLIVPVVAMVGPAANRVSNLGRLSAGWMLALVTVHDPVPLAEVFTSILVVGLGGVAAVLSIGHRKAGRQSEGSDR
jgi:hypothetical protein